MRHMFTRSATRPLAHSCLSKSYAACSSSFHEIRYGSSSSSPTATAFSPSATCSMLHSREGWLLLAELDLVLSELMKLGIDGKRS